MQNTHSSLYMYSYSTNPPEELISQRLGYACVVSVCCVLEGYKRNRLKKIEIPLLLCCFYSPLSPSHLILRSLWNQTLFFGRDGVAMPKNKKCTSTSETSIKEDRVLRDQIMSTMLSRIKLPTRCLCSVLTATFENPSLCMTLQVTLYTVLHCKRDTNLYASSVDRLKASACDQVPFRLTRRSAVPLWSHKPIDSGPRCPHVENLLLQKWPQREL